VQAGRRCNTDLLGNADFDFGVHSALSVIDLVPEMKSGR